MISIELYLAYVAACVAIIIVPGPMVTVIVANSLRQGTRAGLMNVAGSQAGVAVMLLILAAGLQVIVANLAVVFDWLRIFGAAYLIWLGIKLLRSDGRLGAQEPDVPGTRSFFWQGMLVMLSNPKALLFIGAFIPQFIDPAGNPVYQTLVLGLTFMAVGATLDGAYAVAAGRASHWLSLTRIRLLERVSGLCLIGGGVWLALARRT